MDKNKNKSVFKKNIILLNKARTLATLVVRGSVLDFY